MDQNKKLTLLWRFVADKLKAYEEPSRKGTPKGEPIGLSRQKYYATLLCLHNIPLEKVAETVGISHGLLRKWRTESKFIKTIKQHERYFADVVKKNLHQRGERQLKLYQEHMRKSLQEIVKTPPPFLAFTEYEDVASYAFDLLASIINAVLDLSNQMKTMQLDAPGYQTAIQTLFLLAMLRGAVFKAVAAKQQTVQKHIDQLRERETEERNYCLALIRACMLDNNLNETDRKLVAYLTYAIQDRWTIVE